MIIVNSVGFTFITQVAVKMESFKWGQDLFCSFVTYFQVNCWLVN